MTDTDKDDAFLDRYFAEAKAEDIPDQDRLMQRVMLDAEAALAVAPRPMPKVERAPFWAGWLEAIGGWPATGGLVAATVAGLWIGVASPGALADVTGLIWGETVEVPALWDDGLSVLEL